MLPRNKHQDNIDSNTLTQLGSLIFYYQYNLIQIVQANLHHKQTPFCQYYFFWRKMHHICLQTTNFSSIYLFYFPIFLIFVLNLIFFFLPFLLITWGIDRGQGRIRIPTKLGCLSLPCCLDVLNLSKKNSSFFFTSNFLLIFSNLLVFYYTVIIL
jgi:hypothetical protein